MATEQESLNGAFENEEPQQNHNHKPDKREPGLADPFLSDMPSPPNLVAEMISTKYDQAVALPRSRITYPQLQRYRRLSQRKLTFSRYGTPNIDLSQFQMLAGSIGVNGAGREEAVRMIIGERDYQAKKEGLWSRATHLNENNSSNNKNLQQQA